VLTSTLLTLVVVPVIYSYLDRWEVLARTWFAGGVLRREQREAREKARDAERAERDLARGGKRRGREAAGLHGAVASRDPQAPNDD
jgi:hypothetical protein